MHISNFAHLAVHDAQLAQDWCAARRYLRQ